MQKSPSIYLHN